MRVAGVERGGCCLSVRRSLEHGDLRDTEACYMEFPDSGLDARNDVDFEGVSFLEA